MFLILAGLTAASCRMSSQDLTICEIQGTGARSPYTGKSVIVEGIISTDFWNGDPPGFYLQAICPEQETSVGIRVALSEPVDWFNPGR